MGELLTERELTVMSANEDELTEWERLEASEGNDAVVALAEPAGEVPEQYAATEWWDEPYPLAAAADAPPVELVRPLYFPGNPAEKPPSTPGPDVQAIKRGVSRLGRHPWQTFDQQYSKSFATGSGGNVVQTGLAGFQRQSGLDPTGQLGEATFEKLRRSLIPEGLPHAGEFAFDATALNLLQEAAPLALEQEARELIERYCRDSLSAHPVIHYAQVRPVACYGTPPKTEKTTDCSGFASCAIYWPRKQGLNVPDPNGEGWSGYGYTGTLYETNKSRTISGAFEVGDLGLYGVKPFSHVVICYHAGDSLSALWCSHGSEGSPSSVPLHYRSDFACVVRPRLVA